MAGRWDPCTGTRSRGAFATRARWPRPGSTSATRRAPRGSGSTACASSRAGCSTPPHSHGLSEEIYFVLEGSGLLWQDEAVCEVRAGDTVVAARGPLRAHASRAAPTGSSTSSSARVIRSSTAGCRARGAAARLPVGRGTRRQPVGDRGRGRRARVRRAGRAAAERGRARGRPARRRRRQGARRGGGLGAVRPELDPPPRRQARLPAALPLARVRGLRRARGERHARAAAPTRVAAERGAERETTSCAPAHVFARPPGSRVAHSIVAGDEGVTYLAYGTRSRTTSPTTRARTRSTSAASG